MGIDISGGMFVGNSYDAIIETIKLPEEYEESVDYYLTEELWDKSRKEGMSSYSPYYDAPEDEHFYGYPVNDLAVSDMTEEWLESIRTLADKFEKITGCKAELIGMQDIW